MKKTEQRINTRIILTKFRQIPGDKLTKGILATRKAHQQTKRSREKRISHRYELASEADSVGWRVRRKR